jgi:hypothetical protein
MKLPKFLSIVGFVTFFCLLYVYQQTEVFRLAYLGEKKMATLEDLLDKNSRLRYNINRSTSLVYISNKFLDIADFQMPESFRLVRLQLSPGGQGRNMQPLKKENIVFRLFGIKTEALGETINPSNP